MNCQAKWTCESGRVFVCLLLETIKAAELNEMPSFSLKLLGILSHAGLLGWAAKVWCLQLSCLLYRVPELLRGLFLLSVSFSGFEKGVLQFQCTYFISITQSRSHA